jgi:hypothetical protein
MRRALSIRQPYAEMILRGMKRLEYRSRPTAIRERVYLYASRNPSRNAAAWKALRSTNQVLPIGLIVGSVEITGCRHDPRTRRYEWALRSPKRLRHPLKPVNHPQPAFWYPSF